MSNFDNYVYFQEGPGLTSNLFAESGFPFINIRCIENNKLNKKNVQFISDKIANTIYKHFKIESGDILLSTSGSLGKKVKIKNQDLPLMLNTSIMRFRSKNTNDLINEYLFYYLESRHLLKQVEKEAQGSAQVNLGPTHFKKFDIYLPNLPTQKRIAKILSTVDGQIEKTDAIIAKYQAIKQGMLHDLFTRGIDLATGKLRPTPEQAPELYKSSPLGLIPKAWEAMRIDQVAEITTGCKDTQNKVENGIYPFFVRSQHIESINSYSYDGEAILTAGDGVGVGKVFHYIKGKFDFHQRVYMLSNFKLEICGKYIFEFFKTHFLAEVDKYSAKTTVDSVRLEMIAGMLIPIAKFEEQILISLKINQLDKLIAYESINQNKLKNLKHGLMSKLLQGNK